MIFVFPLSTHLCLALVGSRDGDFRFPFCWCIASVMDVTGAGAKGTVVVTDAALREREREKIAEKA